MERQLDDVGGQLLQKSLEERGLHFLIGAQTERWSATAAAGVAPCASRTAPSPSRPGRDGRRHPPNTALAEIMRLHCNRGIVVNDTMQTVTDARIYSVGECAAHRGIAYGLVAPLFEQAKVAANHLAQFGIGRYQAR
jgi:nitrite reductase (NADH) large subunit